MVVCEQVVADHREPKPRACRADIVTVRGLTHRYAENLALSDVDLAVEEASLFALLGPNGCGKTTLFKILTTMLRPTAGGATVAGVDVVTQRAAVRRRIGIVFQHPSLDDKLTVRENLVHQGNLYGLFGKPLATRIDELLSRFGVASRTNDFVEKLSGGLKRRVELAKSLLHRPGVLILDEPSTGLDPGARLELIAQLRELRDSDGVTCLMTTHLMDEADRCDCVGLMDRGRLVALDTPSALKATIGGDVLTVDTLDPRALAADITFRLAAVAEAVDGAVRIECSRGHEFLPTLIEMFPGRIQSVKIGKPTLEDVFLHATGHSLAGTTQPEAEVN